MSKIVFLFPGQGSQYVGMGKTLCENYPVAKSVFKEANEVLGYDLKKICFNGPHEKLSETVNTQPAILTSSVAAFRVFNEELGLEPDLVAGHSFGALSALVCAGSISFKDALKLARLKGERAEKAVAGKKSLMVAVENLKEETVAKVCKSVSGEVYVAIVNSAKQIVVSGEEAAVERAEKELLGLGGKTERLYVSAPFHTPLLKEAAENAKAAVKKIKLQKNKWPILSTIDVKLHKDAKGMINDLYFDLIRPTKWLAAVQYMVKSKINIGIEIGPKTVLKKIVENTTDKISMHSFISPRDMDDIKKSLKLDKESKEDVLIACLRIFASTMNYNHNQEDFELGASKPYREIRELLDKLREKKEEPTMENVFWSLEKLEVILNTKKLDVQEKKERFYEEIFNANEILLRFPRVRAIADRL
ncbi:MAG: ACP S-malonyltransferase [Candidatus Falkowbacteria bacterium]